MLGCLGLVVACALWFAWLQSVTDALERQWPTRFPWLLPVRGKWAGRLLLGLSLLLAATSLLLLIHDLRG